MNPIIVLIILTALSFPTRALGQQNYRYQVAKKVLQKLIDAKGNYQMKAPSFVLNEGRSMVAWMDGETAEIGLEVAAYDICKTFGADSLNALAALLGHEVTHYYEKHSWGSKFATAYGSTEMGKQVKKATGSVSSNASQEIQADQLGGFLAYSAGFQTFHIMSALLDKIYIEYQLPNEIMGYPSLNDRKDLALKSAEEAKKLAWLFDSANYLSMIGDFQSADQCYGELLKTFQSREIYNNAGVNICLMLLKCFDTQDVAKFAYPLEYDCESRLQAGSLGVSYDDEQKAELYAKAAAYFKSAEDLDPNYLSAKVNKACLAVLQKAYTDGEYFAQKAQEAASNTNNLQVLTDALIIKGIIAAKQGKKEQAKTSFEEAFEKSGQKSRLALVNLQVLNGKKLKELKKYYRLIPGLDESVVADNAESKKGKEKIDGNTLEKTIFETEKTKPEYTVKTKYMELIFKNLENGSRLVSCTNTDTRKQSHLQLGKEGSSTERGLVQGDNAEKIYKLYGNPSAIHHTLTGDYLLYPQAGIIIRYHNDRTYSWLLFYQN